ncbi:hypothetical protein ACFYTC_46115 [Actinomadura nitritigenes]|uniref:hypothetical protein n=1 Tax=Actinomadura nitritigenes TaxID=134602 RepID=UPI0036A51544
MVLLLGRPELRLAAVEALVSGAVALVRARNPSMSGRTVVQRLIATALPTTKPVPDKATGYGVIRIARAIDPVKYPVPANAPNPVYDRFDRSQHAVQQAGAVSPGPAAGSHRSGGGPSTAVQAAIAGLAVLVVGGVLVWLRGRRRSRPPTSA